MTVLWRTTWSALAKALSTALRSPTSWKNASFPGFSVPDRRGSGCQCRLCADDRGQQLIIDVDQFGGVLTQHITVRLARGLDVVDIAAPAPEKAEILLTPHRHSDRLHAHSLASRVCPDAASTVAK